MDLMREIELIKEHFKNISEEELEEKLVTLGLEEIRTLDSEGINWMIEDNTKDFIYSNKQELYYHVDPNSTIYNLQSKLLIEVA